MAYQDTHHSHTHDIADRLLRGAKAFLGTVGSALISISEANRRSKLVERLQSKTDAELAELGMKREDIVRHVFRDMLDV